MTIRNFQQNGARIRDAMDIRGNVQGSFAVSGTGTDVDDLPAGTYAIWCEEATCYIRVHETDASDVTVASAGGKGGAPLMQGNVDEVEIRKNDHLGAVTAGAAGTFRYHKK